MPREQAPRDQALAEDLLERLPCTLPPRAVPAAEQIARRYQIPYPTAQFVRRAVVTRLRPPADHPFGGTVTPLRLAWLRVADDLRHQIRTGRLTGRLLVRPELAARYKVCVDTAGTAIRALTEMGLLAPASPHGTYVLPQSARAPQQRGAPG
ncbi:GntR family transcriptional regulator [Streptomyces sp. TRM66268-LWL]|uniref:GntR family transcriptional regulator n=1 Tax=Streptomyces polyasparticus TaxID=2767826 RepID=A0ABR7SVA2_9ACTN|nr:GntR family transcriptional regulator [Streptomyces polyasparticus]MBC9719436.1 GntR family transcriptional regulator [Streptomyces polyasparticus]